MFCPNCGNEVKDGAVFCPECGFKLPAEVPAPKTQAEPAEGMPANAGATPETTPAQAQDASQNVGTVPMGGPAQDQNAYNTQGGPKVIPVAPAPQVKKQSHAWIPVVIIAGVLLLAGLVVLGVVAAKSLGKAVMDKANVEEKTIENDSPRNTDTVVPTATAEPTEEPMIEGEGEGEFDDTPYTELIPVDAEASNYLDQIDSDFKKIKWDNNYSIKDAEGVIITTSDAEINGHVAKVYAVTNLYSDTLQIYGNIAYKDGSGDTIAEDFFQNEAISTGSSGIGMVVFPDNKMISSDPEIEFYIYNADFEEGYWEADFGMTLGQTDDGTACAKLSVEISNPVPDTVYFGYIDSVAVDKDGKVVAYGYNYFNRSIAGNGKEKAELELFGDPEKFTQITDVATFINTNVTDQDSSSAKTANLNFASAYFESDNGDYLYLMDNNDGTFGVYFAVVSKGWIVAYTDVDAENNDGVLDFKDVDTGEHVGYIYVSDDYAYVYIYNSGTEHVDNGKDVTMNKTEITSSKEADFKEKINSRR